MGRRAGLPTIFLPTGSTIYWCRFTLGGKRHAASTGERDPSAAAKAATHIYAEAARDGGEVAPRRAGRVVKTPLEVLFAQFIAQWEIGRSSGYVRKAVSHFRAHFAPRWRRIGQITTDAIERYKVERIQEAKQLRHARKRPAFEYAGTVTLHKELVTLSQFLEWARKRGHIGDVPHFERVTPVSDYQTPNIAPEDVQRLIAALPCRETHRHGHPVREWFTVQWAQAFRPGELETLRWCDVDLRRHEMTVRVAEDKSRDGRTIGMAHETFAVLSRMAEDAHLPTALVFGAHNYRRSLESAAERCKLPRVVRHHLRHFRLSELGETTTDVGALQYFAGHKHLATTDRYVKSRTERTHLLLANSGKDSFHNSRRSDGASRRTLPKQRQKHE